MILENVKHLSDEEMEEKREEMLDKASEFIKDVSHKIAMIKAILWRENDVRPEDFDKALNKELVKEWDKVKDKDGTQLAIMGLLEMMAAGEAVDSLFSGEGEE